MQTGVPKTVEVVGRDAMLVELPDRGFVTQQPDGHPVDTVAIVEACYSSNASGGWVEVRKLIEN